MSYIVNSKIDLMLVKDLFNIYRKENMNVDLLEIIVRELIPKDKNGDILIGYELYNNGGGFPLFSLSENYLNLSIDELYVWIDKNSKVAIDKFNVKDMELFKDYMFFFVLCHEIEHSYQYLMAYDVVDAPCDLVRDSYKLIIDSLICRNYDKIGKLKILRNRLVHYLYYKNSYKYVIERNANVEAFDLMQMLAIENEHDHLISVFNDMRNSFLLFGYLKDNKGCFDETMKDILLWYDYKKMDHNYVLCNIDRYRYGLPISLEYRNEIIELMKIRCKK